MLESHIPEFDWQSGTAYFPTTATKQPGKEWSLLAAGDWAPIVQPQTQSLDPTELYGDLLPILRNADLALVNVECVLSDHAEQPIVKDGNVIPVPARGVTGLSSVPFHLACLANNHAFDLGVAGLRETFKQLEANGIRAVGAGFDTHSAEAPAIFEVGGKRVAVVNVAEGEEARSTNGKPGVATLDEVRLRAELPCLRKQVDVVVVIVHAGREFLPTPAPYIRKLYRMLIECGADLVVGHHPHVAQGIEIYHGKPIVYSLGNFVFFLNSAIQARQLGYCLSAKFSGSELCGIQIFPYSIHANRLELLTGKQRERFFKILAEQSSILVQADRLEDVWNAYADAWWELQGRQEISESVALATGETIVFQAALKARLYHLQSQGWSGRIARSGLWRVIHWLGKRIRARPLSCGADTLSVKRGASILRNRFETLSQRELYLTALDRVMHGTLGNSPAWAKKALVDWHVFG